MTLPPAPAQFNQPESKLPVFNLDVFHQTYDTVATPVSINNQPLTLFMPRSIDRFIDDQDTVAHFPLWAKIWEASAILASYLDGLPAEPGKRMLEIGCGLGLVGIAAARAGHQVTMTEINADALAFARANALANDCPQLLVERLDWNAPHLSGRYDYIVGSETLYKAEDAGNLEALFDRYLAADGTIILSAAMRGTSIDFLERMRHRYHVQAKRQSLISDQEEQHMILVRMQPKGA